MLLDCGVEVTEELSLRRAFDDGILFTMAVLGTILR
jgi:hypothetical protein